MHLIVHCLQSDRGLFILDAVTLGLGLVVGYRPCWSYPLFGRTRLFSAFVGYCLLHTIVPARVYRTSAKRRRRCMCCPVPPNVVGTTRHGWCRLDRQNIHPKLRKARGKYGVFAGSLRSCLPDEIAKVLRFNTATEQQQQWSFKHLISCMHGHDR